MDISALRQRINAVDEQLLKLFLERMSLSDAVAQYKLENSLPILDRQRERAILSNVSEQSGDYAPYARHLFLTLLGLSKSRQNELISNHTCVYGEIVSGTQAVDSSVFPRGGSVACQGIEGANSQSAAEKLLPNGDIVFVDSFKAVIDAVESGLCRFGILPVENSVNGSVRAVYELLKDSNCSIVRSTRLCIRHSLLACKGSKPPDIREILSHEQAIGQCSSFLATLPDAKAVRCANTAVAAKLVAEYCDGTKAAICSPECAKIYGLERIADDIQDSDNNYTRFVMITKGTLVFDGASKISLTLTASNKPGILYELLRKPAVLGINVSKLESLPITGRDFEFRFILEIDASVLERGVIRMLEELERESESFRFLGCFSEV